MQTRSGPQYSLDSLCGRCRPQRSQTSASSCSSLSISMRPGCHRAVSTQLTAPRAPRANPFWSAVLPRLAVRPLPAAALADLGQLLLELVDLDAPWLSQSCEHTTHRPKSSSCKPVLVRSTPSTRCAAAAGRSARRPRPAPARACRSRCAQVVRRILALTRPM